MSHDVKQKKSYSQSAEQVSQLAASAIEQIGGNPSDRSNPAKGQLEAVFNKKVKDQPLMSMVHG